MPTKRGHILTERKSRDTKQLSNTFVGQIFGSSADMSRQETLFPATITTKI